MRKGILYVSDVLEQLIDGTEIRELVRQHCRAVLAPLSPNVQAKLSEPLRYSAGKCMGYPAVWLVQKALDASLPEMSERLGRSPGPLYISLTTSIADDYLDREPNVRPAHMMILYLFVFGALAEPRWMHAEQLDHWRRNIFPLIEWFILNQGENVRASESAAFVELAGRRIGAFFEAIAYGLVGGEGSASGKRIVSLAGDFGCWCSDLDDIIDVEADIAAGAHVTSPIKLVMDHSPALRQAVIECNADACLPVIHSEGFMSALAERQFDRLSALVHKAESAGLTSLAQAFVGVKSRLARTLLEIQTRAPSPKVREPLAASVA